MFRPFCNIIVDFEQVNVCWDCVDFLKCHKAKVKTGLKKITLAEVNM